MRLPRERTYYATELSSEPACSWRLRQRDGQDLTHVVDEMQGQRAQ